MDEAGRSWRLYAPLVSDNFSSYGYSICPTFAECLYTEQAENHVHRDQFLTDAAAGTLPELSIVIPLDEDSQHNNFSMIQGDNWLGSRVDAAMNGPDWDSTAVFITYDDCGCFYDQVPPPEGLGIRTPMVIVSPWARPGYTDSNVASYASMMTFVEHTFGLAPLSVRDAGAYDFSQSFDFTQTPLPPIPIEQNPVPPETIRWMKANPPPPDDPT
jgi:phospholipase C